MLKKLSDERKLRRSDVYVCKPTGFLPKKRPAPYILMLSLKDFTRNLDKLYQNATYLIFDSAIHLSKYDITYMDMMVGDKVHQDGLVRTPIELDLEGPELMFSKSHFDVIEQSIAEVKAQRTLLNQLMTFIYTLPRASHQRPVKEVICKWLPTKYNKTKLFANLKTIRDAPLSDKQIERLSTILSSETADIYRKALQEGGDSDLLADKYQVSAYEINYIRAINGSS